MDGAGSPQVPRAHNDPSPVATALRKILVYTLLAAVLAAALLAAGAGYAVYRPLTVPGGAVELRVAAGSSARGIARQLREAGVDVPAWQFAAVATLDHATRSLRPGRYRIEGTPTLLELVDKFRRGEVERERLTILEGITFAELRAALAQSAELRHDTAGWSEAQILKALGAPQAQAEGLFAPDTYSFDPGSSDLEVLRQAYAAQQQRLAKAWEARRPGLPYTEPYQALVMASIVEKETGRADERRRIAAVFANRQRLGMPLQTDPSVIYGLGTHFAGRLHKRDLLADTPYNTYTRAGLPPTPIALPGRAAIDAALDPEPSPVLYFVARGDGSSEFSLTLAEHNRAVDRFQRGVHAASAAHSPTSMVSDARSPQQGARP